MDDNAVPFETGFAELEQVVARLQEGNLPLEESLALFERGMQLAQSCGTQLEQAELRGQLSKTARQIWLLPAG